MNACQTEPFQYKTYYLLHYSFLENILLYFLKELLNSIIKKYQTLNENDTKKYKNSKNINTISKEP